MNPSGGVSLEDEVSHIVGQFFVSGDVFVSISSYSKPALDMREVREALETAMEQHEELEMLRNER